MPEKAVSSYNTALRVSVKVNRKVRFLFLEYHNHCREADVDDTPEQQVTLECNEACIAGHRTEVRVAEVRRL